MENLAEHIGAIMSIGGSVIGILLVIIGYFITSKFSKTDDNIEKLFTVVSANKDKLDDVITENKEKVQTDIEKLHEQTRELELNYNKKFGDVRQDISNLKEDNASQHNELKLMLGNLSNQMTSIKGGI